MQPHPIFDICKSGTLAQLEACLSVPEHAFCVHACNEAGDTPLHVLISHWDQDVEAGVLLLVAKGASIRALGHELKTPLGVAIYNWSPFCIIRHLVVAGLPMMADKRGNVPLSCFLVNYLTDDGEDDDYFNSLDILLSNSMSYYSYDIHQHVFRFADERVSIFSFACRYGTAKTVDRLYRAEDAPRLDVIVPGASFGPLQGACQNRAEVLDLLLSKSRFLHTRSVYHRDITMGLISNADIEMLKTFLHHFKQHDLPNAADYLLVNRSLFPMSNLMERLLLITNHFRVRIELNAGNDIDQWIAARHGISMHTAPSSYNRYDIRELKVKDFFWNAVVNNHTAAINDCMLQFINPFIPNSNGKAILDGAKNPELKKRLEDYAQWSVKKQKTWWYGPLFEARARTLMLVRQRWMDTGVRNLPKDVCYCIIRHLARTEITWIPMYKKWLY